MLTLPMITIELTGASLGATVACSAMQWSRSALIARSVTICMYNALQLQVLGKSLHTKCILNQDGWANGIVNENYTCISDKDVSICS